MQYTAVALVRRCWKGRLLALGSASILAACSSPTDTTPLAWEAELSALGPAGPTGSVALLSQYGRTDASIAIEGALPDTTYGWRINAGTCDEEGAILGGQAVYPSLTTDADGEGGRDATIGGSPGASTPYAARLLLPADGGSVVACGELARVTP